MRIRRRYYLITIAVLTTLALSACGKDKMAEESGDVSVSVTKVEGIAKFQHSVEGTPEDLVAGQTLVEADIVLTGEDGLAVIQLEQGKEVTIGSDTVFALSAIRRDSSGNINIMSLQQGNVISDVETKLEEGDRYEIHTPRLVMSVRGTSNYLESDAGKDTLIGITGETHAYADGRKANILQGMKVIDNSAGEWQMLPATEADLPEAVKTFVKEKEIPYTPMSQSAIEEAQKGVENNEEPYDLGEVDRSFFDHTFTVTEELAASNVSPLASIEPKNEITPEGNSSPSAVPTEKPKAVSRATPAVTPMVVPTEIPPAIPEATPIPHATPVPTVAPAPVAADEHADSGSGNSGNADEGKNENQGGNHNGNDPGPPDIIGNMPVTVFLNIGGECLETGIKYKMNQLREHEGGHNYSLTGGRLLSDYPWLGDFVELDAVQKVKVTSNDGSYEAVLGVEFKEKVDIRIDLLEYEAGVDGPTELHPENFSLPLSSFSVKDGLIDVSGAVEEYLNGIYTCATDSRKISEGATILFSLDNIKAASGDEPTPLEIIVEHTNNNNNGNNNIVNNNIVNINIVNNNNNDNDGNDDNDDTDDTDDTSYDVDDNENGNH